METHMPNSMVAVHDLRTLRSSWERPLWLREGLRVLGSDGHQLKPNGIERSLRRFEIVGGCIR